MTEGLFCVSKALVSGHCGKCGGREWRRATSKSLLSLNPLRDALELRTM